MSESNKKGKAKIGEWLKRFRQWRGLTQKQVADDIGILPEVYRTYELGKTSPSVGVVIDLSKKYGVSADYLLGLSDEPSPVRAEAPASVIDDEFTKAAFAIAEAMRTAVNQRLQEKAEV